MCTAVSSRKIRIIHIHTIPQKKLSEAKSPRKQRMSVFERRLENTWRHPQHPLTIGGIMMNFRAAYITTGRIVFICLLFVTPFQLYAGENPVDKTVGYFKKEIKEGSWKIRSALNRYSNLERSGTFDIFGRHRIHRELVKALKESGDARLGDITRKFLKRRGLSDFPAQVVLMKAMRGNRFPMPRKERVELFVSIAKVDRLMLSIWGVRSLGDAKWPEAIDALITIMEEEERSGRSSESILWSITAAELYRVLGKHAPQGSTSALIKQNWKDMGKKVPKTPDHTIRIGNSRTAAFFGDMISPRSVFAIDHSTSMRQEATLRQRTSKRTATDKEIAAASKKEKKVLIVKRELEKCIKRLQHICRFNILGYNAKIHPWRARGGKLNLHAATSSTIESAVEYTRELAVNRGTNIHDTLQAALLIPELDTIYLLSDGCPSVGGGTNEIKKRVAAMNYLRGIRVVTYGFTAEKQGSFDEGFMKQLAADNWGWYHRLNK